MKNYIYMGLAVISIGLGVSGCSDDDDSSQYSKTVLTQGADLNGSVSLNFNPAGEMFVIDAFSSRLLNMNPETGEILETFTEAIEPADLDFALDGTLYWVNPFVGEIYKKTTDGEISRIAELNTVIDGVTVSNDGRVFTASFVPGEDALWEIDPMGITEPRLIVELGGFDAFDMGPDGYLYAPDYLNGTGEIYQINVDTGAVRVITDGFCQPISVKLNSLGELYVIDYLCPKVVKVDIATGEQTLVANVDPGADNFDFDANDRLFVAFHADSYIGEVLNDGTVRKVTTPGMSSPGSLALREDGTLFVADGFAMRRIDVNTGEVQQSFYTDTGMIPPFTLYDDGDNLILSCHLFSGIQIWDPDTNQAVATYTDFIQPTNAIRYGDDIVVAEGGNGSVLKLSDRSPLVTDLELPGGLAVNGDELYVADWETGNIWHIATAGVALNPARTVVEGLSNPEGMRFDKDGKLLVVEVGKKRLLRIDLDSQQQEVLTTDLAVGLHAPVNTADTWVALSDVVIAESGDMYVTGDVDNVIYKLHKP